MQHHFVEAGYRLPMRRMVWLGCLWMLGLGALMTLVGLLSPSIDHKGIAITLEIMVL